MAVRDGGIGVWLLIILATLFGVTLTCVGATLIVRPYQFRSMFIRRGPYWALAESDRSWESRRVRNLRILGGLCLAWGLGSLYLIVSGITRPWKQ